MLVTEFFIKLFDNNISPMEFVGCVTNQLGNIDVKNVTKIKISLRTKASNFRNVD